MRDLERGTMRDLEPDFMRDLERDSIRHLERYSVRDPERTSGRQRHTPRSGRWQSLARRHLTVRRDRGSRAVFRRRRLQACGARAALRTRVVTRCPSTHTGSGGRHVRVQTVQSQTIQAIAGLRCLVGSSPQGL